MTVLKSICVFCSSSDAVDPMYAAVAADLGAQVAKRGLTLVYGGTHVGLMGVVADAAKNNGGRVIGIIPRVIQEKGLANKRVDELVVTDDMRSRKALMEERSDAFIALPGGFGTLEETLEIITRKQLGLSLKPIVLINTDGYYDRLNSFFEHMIEKKFTKPGFAAYYAFCSGSTEALEYLDRYSPPTVEHKWFAGSAQNR